MSVLRSTLSNGVRVVTEHMPQARSASIGFWVGAGARDEPDELAGSCHFLEHVLFKGTPTRSAREIAEAFDAVGGDANAFTSREYTCFHARVLDEDLPMAMEILSDILLHSLFLETDVKSEKGVILEEIAMHEDTPDELVHDVFSETVFPAHPLGRSILGRQDTVASITPSSLRGFWEEHYLPKNLVVAAAGNVAHPEIIDLVEKYFPSNATAAAIRSDGAVAFHQGSAIRTRDSEQAHLVIGGQGLSRSHEDRFAWSVLDVVLGGGMSSRLFQKIREERGLAYSVYSYRAQFAETGYFAVYAGTSPQKAGELLDLVVGELDDLAAGSMTPEEFVRAKSHLKGGLVLSQEDSGSRMMRLGKSELVHGELMSADEVLKRIDAVTQDDVARVVQALLTPRKFSLAAIGPFSDGELDRHIA